VSIRFVRRLPDSRPSTRVSIRFVRRLPDFGAQIGRQQHKGDRRRGRSVAAVAVVVVVIVGAVDRWRRWRGGAVDRRVG
jgi:hypothetical protein